MPFSSLSAGQRLKVILELVGGPQYAARMKEADAATAALGRSTVRTAEATALLTRRTFAQNQLLFTGRRLLFYSTLGVLALAGAAMKMGFAYNSALQTSRVALQPVIRDQQVLNNELDALYRIAALSPFLFKDTVVAFRQMYAAFHPLGFSIEFTNRTIQSLVDSLSYAGRTTPAALNRVSVALQHMAFLGRPTARVIQQLASDGLPIYAALNKELGLSHNQLKNIANSGITAKQILQALNKYVATTPGYMNAALRQSNSTLLGAWRQFQDIFSRAMGTSEGGLFTGLTRRLAAVNNYLAPLLKNNKPITLYNVAQAINSSLTPNTNTIINLFVLFQNALAGVIWQFRMLGLILSGPLKLFGLISGVGKSNEFVFKVLGRALSVLIVLWGIGKTRQMAIAFWTEVNTTRAWLGVGAMKAWRAAEAAKVAWQARDIVSLRTLAFTQVLVYEGGWKSVYKYNSGLARLARFMTLTAIPAFTGMAAASWAFTASLLANPITWIVVAFVALTAGLVVLYFKWKAFRDVVNETYYWLGLFSIPFTGFIGFAIAIYHWWDSILNIIKTAAHFAGRVWGFWKHPFGLHIPGFATGGVMPSTGFATVGERGPETLILPGGTTIVPHGANVAGAGAGGGLHFTITPQAIYFDGHKIGEVLATIVTDKEARA